MLKLGVQSLACTKVPRGYHKGPILPLLFIIAINGLAKVIRHSKPLVFADDFKIFMEILSENDCDNMQEDVNRVVDWCDINGFQLNIKKCVCMTFSLKKNLMVRDYTVDGTILKRVSTYKDLGVTFDPGLAFTEHIAIKINEAYRIMGFIISSKHLNVNICLKLFDSLVLPKLEYGAIIWSPQYANWGDLLEQVHRKFLKYMFFKKYGIYPERGFNHQELLNIFHRISLESRRIKNCLVYIYKVLNQTVDDPNMLGQLPFSVNRLNSRHKTTFYLDFPRTNLYRNSPLYRMCDLFNRFVSDIDVQSLTVKRFKYIIDQKLMMNQI